MGLGGGLGFAGVGINSMLCPSSSPLKLSSHHISLFSATATSSLTKSQGLGLRVRFTGPLHPASYLPGHVNYTTSLLHSPSPGHTFTTLPPETLSRKLRAEGSFGTAQLTMPFPDLSQFPPSPLPVQSSPLKIYWSISTNTPPPQALKKEHPSKSPSRPTKTTACSSTSANASPTSRRPSVPTAL